jgi:hypothetical protein
MSTRKSLRTALVLAALLAGLGSGLCAQQTFNTTIYFDWTHFLSDNGPKTTAPPNTPSFKNDFFAFRRAYFTYENKINDNLKFRFRYDADNTANLISVDSSFKTKKDDKLRPFIKHLYLEYSNLIPRAALRVGMTETLCFKLAEDRWGYRSVAKTLADGYKDITGVDIRQSSADLGISLAGSLNKYVRYGAMVQSGEGYGHAEVNGWKKFAFQGQLIPVPGLSLVGYFDTERQDKGKNAVTYKFDGYFEMVKGLVIGSEYFVYQNDLYLVGTDRYDVSGLSVFGRYAITPGTLNMFARYDSYEPNSKVDKDQTSLVIAGLDWAPWGSAIKFQPNIWIQSYQDSAKKNDVIFNMTFFMSF